MTGAVFAAPYVDPSFVARYMKTYGNDVQVAWAAMGYEFAKLSAKLLGNLEKNLSADEILRRLSTASGNQGTASRFVFEESSDGSGFDFEVTTCRVEADRIIDITQ